jgi:hypothetical protein
VVEHVRRQAQLDRLCRSFPGRRPTTAHEFFTFVYVGRAEKLPRQFGRVIRINPFSLSRAFVPLHEHTSSK